MSPTPAHKEDIPDLPPVLEMKREFLFSNHSFCNFWADSEHWYADGTFRVCPEFFFQLHTLHGQRD